MLILLSFLNYEVVFLPIKTRLRKYFWNLFSLLNKQKKIIVPFIPLLGNAFHGIVQDKKEALELIKQYKPKVFVCGHSHILKVIYDKKNEMLVINPGSAGKYGFHKSYTAIKFIIENNDIRDMQVLDIPKN